MMLQHKHFVKVMKDVNRKTNNTNNEYYGLSGPRKDRLVFLVVFLVFFLNSEKTGRRYHSYRYVRFTTGNWDVLKQFL